MNLNKSEKNSFQPNAVIVEKTLEKNNFLRTKPFSLNVKSYCDHFAQHDPGKRKKIQGTCRRFLISLGPYQPILTPFPRSLKRGQFKTKWYNLYPMIEYSTENNAAYCFVCSLFAIRCGYKTTVWAEDGVKIFKGMEGKGGKLARHFHSRVHKEAFSDYCIFKSQSKSIDGVFNRISQLKINQTNIYNETENNQEQSVE